MRKCSRCKEEKPDSEYYAKGKDRLQSHCKKCHSTYCIQRWTKIKLRAIEYKGGACKRCGYKKYYGALEFHHRDPSQKDVDWGELRLRNWNKITYELDKCDLLCSVCHREVHAEMNGEL